MTCEYSAGLPLGYLGNEFDPPYVASGPEAHPPSPPTDYVRYGSDPRDIRPSLSNSGVHLHRWGSVTEICERGLRPTSKRSRTGSG
jgi:hypothetical protein